MSEIASALGGSMKRAFFAPSSSLSDVLEALSPSDRELKKLFPDERWGHLPVFQTKHLGGQRCGSYLSPSANLNFCRFVPDLLENYQVHCRHLDNDRVFFPIFKEHSFSLEQQPFNEYRMSNRVFELSNSYGRWVAHMDIQRCYEKLSASFIYAALSGPSGLCLAPALVDSVCHLIEELSQRSDKTLPDFRGLPQGYAVSALIARLALAPIDRELIDRGIPYVRRQDDLVVLGHDRMQVSEHMGEVQKILHGYGLFDNPEKRHISMPRTFDLASRGIYWDIPEDPKRFLQFTRRKPNLHVFIEEYALDVTQQWNWDEEDVELPDEELYPRYFRPHQAKRSERLTVYVTADAASRNLRSLVEDLPAMTQSRKAVLGRAVKALPEDCGAQAWRCATSLPQKSQEHLVRELLKAPNSTASKKMFEKALHKGRFSNPAVRMTAIEQSSCVETGLLQQFIAGGVFEDEGVAMIQSGTLTDRKATLRIYETLLARGDITKSLLKTAMDFYLS